MASFYKLQIKEIKRETPSAVSVVFNIPNELQSAYQFIAGQYINLKLTLDGKEIRRAYSICSSPNSGELRIAIKAIKNGLFSKFANENLSVGDILEVGQPEGKFTFEPNFEKQKNYTTKGSDYWHPGYAWAITRKAYEKLNGLYDKGILGSSDSIIAMSLINKCNSINNANYNKDYNNSMLDYQKIASKLRLGYTPGIIRHYYHGSKINRKYTERWKILMKYNFSPYIDITYDSSGIIIPTNFFSQEFKDEILNYFKERKEDE